mmetsp:Transcript_71078/g.125966  ORF Transcript_71078/g.125966 Transcript_71078/m.125966 type:complete len:164 (+) Transcript_71078:51-542(+)
MEHCCICLTQQICAHIRKHNAKGSKQLCGPIAICAPCSSEMCIKFRGEKQFASGQFICPICRASLGTKRRALEESKEQLENLEKRQALVCPAASVANAATAAYKAKDGKSAMGPSGFMDQVEYICKAAYATSKEHGLLRKRWRRAALSNEHRKRWRRGSLSFA